ncbi:MAG: hypothetical protein DHS20C14_09390 [Phycisphaeraceae bacterium]|nr:MAG: hypothetical protein DHS20C14_09390 [Phycisphaeraceae bacterium]
MTSPERAVPSIARPVALRERFASMDVLRGFALLGILVPNIFMFAFPWVSGENADAMAEAVLIAAPETYMVNDAANALAIDVMGVFFMGKFMFLFATLFGAGVVLFDRKFHTPDVRVPLSRGAGVWYVRCAWLLAIGLVHAFGLWFGDILVWYALAGMAAVWWIRRWRPRTLIIFAIVTYLFGTLVWLGMMAIFDQMIQNGDMPAEQMTGPSPADDIAVYAHGSYLDAVIARIKTLVPWYFIMPFTFFWQITGLMALGIALARLGVYTGQRSAKFYATLALVGIPVGLAITLGVAHFVEGLNSPLSGMYWMAVAQLAGAPLALGYAGLVLLGTRAAVLRPLAAALAAVGRMALTNYLLQTVICTSIFYGHGLGLYGSVQFPLLWFVVGAVWIVNIAFSLLWLSIFRFGPAEWVWRSLTYRRPQPLLRDLLKTAGA